MTIVNMIDLMVNERRKRHILAVKDFSEKLALKWNADMYKCKIAALAHDLFRDVPNDRIIRIANAYKIDINDEEKHRPVLLHGVVSARFIERRFGIKDREILNAVATHTWGSISGGLTGEILCIADSLEEGRNYDGVEKLRALAFDDLDATFKLVVKNKILYSMSREYYIFEDTVKLWNELISRRDAGE
jgi:predicted HD superfamily hydrolase involved in NAD metabolism